MKYNLFILLYALSLAPINSKSNRFNIFQKILRNLNIHTNKDHKNDNQQLHSVHNHPSKEQTNFTPAIQEVTILIVNKIISYAIFYASFKLITNTISASWKKAMDQVNEMKDSLSSTSSNIPSNHTKYLKPNTTLNSYEIEIFQTILTPLSIDTNMNDIGGLESIKSTLLQQLLMQPSRINTEITTNYNSSNSDTIASNSNNNSSRLGKTNHPLYKSIKSFLLYGPPGCGKSMLARAICKELDIPILMITPSLLLRMYIGETSRLTKALFTLSNKMQPCILFIDEIDSIFCKRTSNQHSVDRNIITEFMQLWDDLIRSDAEVYVIGATNRPQDLDDAIQRRFERSFLLDLPDYESRVEIFRIILKDVSKEEDVFDYYQCADMTEGYSASDINMLCRSAAMIPLQENSKEFSSIRPLTNKDIEVAAECVSPIAWASQSYATSLPYQPPHYHHSSSSSSSSSSTNQQHQQYSSRRNPVMEPSTSTTSSNKIHETTGSSSSSIQTDYNDSNKNINHNNEDDDDSINNNTYDNYEDEDDNDMEDYD